MERAQRLEAQVRQATALMEAASRALGEVHAAEAVALAAAFARAEKVAMAATRRAVLQAGDAGARTHGGERDMAGLAARITGSTPARARNGLRTAQRAAARDGVERAYIAGSLSFEQAAVVAETAMLVPGATDELLREADQTSLSGLRAAATARLAGCRGEAAALEQEQKVVARRFCRIGPAPGGGVRVEALLPSAEGAALATALERAADRCWRRSWERGRPLSAEQARADGLVALCTGGGAEGSRLGPPELVVTVDAAALVRGEVADGETCEIDGVGPVSVSGARGLLGEALLTICITDGRDVRTVTSTTRVVPRRVRKALALRDPACVVPGCGQRSHLEIDHCRLDFAGGGLTALDNLCRLCPAHHRLKTRTGWRLGGGPGRWSWSPPPRRV